MTQDKPLNVAIIGGGPGCKAIMDMIFGQKLKQLKMKLVGVACTNTEAVGYRYARERGIIPTRDYRNLFKIKDLDMIIELTGRDEVTRDVSQTKPEHVLLIDHVSANFFWDIFQIEEERSSERERNAEMLRVSEAKWRSLVENSLTGIYIDQDESIVFANKTFAEIYRYPLDEIIGIDFWKLIHPESLSMVKDIRKKRLLDEDAPLAYESRDLTKDGKTLWTKRRNTIIEHNGKTAILGNVVDITDQKLAEEALQTAFDELEIRVKERTIELSKANMIVKKEMADRKHTEAALKESEERYRTLFEESRDAIFITNRKGEFIDVNQSFRDTFGYKREEMVGMDIRDICMSPDDQRKFALVIEQKGSVRDFEMKFQKKDGTRMDCLITGTLRKDNEGTVIGKQGIIRDVTERKRLRAQLRQSQKMEALGRMAAGVAHEINNPLTTILTSAMLLQEDTDRSEPNYTEYETIANETLRCRSIASSLLDFARKKAPEKGKYNINDIVIESLKLTKKQAAFKDVVLTHVLSEGIPEVSVDKNQIIQSLINLILNAVEACQAGGSITATTAFLSSDNDIEIVVTDTGEGIEKNQLDKIFDPFFSTKKSGTGLGMAITHGIIQQHGGTIDVKSRPGHGTTFTIKLPIDT